MLLNNKKITKLTDLDSDTYSFFKKIPGFDTLRLVLSKKAILVEGPSDELIVQRAYMDSNGGKLPIDDGIDIISVKLTFKRFLEIAKRIDKQVAVVTDNDHDFENKITKKYEEYKDVSFIKIFADDRDGNDDKDDLHTLEPQFVDANNEGLEKLCRVTGVDYSKYYTEEAISNYMKDNKTDWALNVFDSAESLNYPEYINNVISWCGE